MPTALTTVFQYAIVSANTAETAYTCPASTTVQIPGINVCNRAGATTFRVWKEVSGDGADQTKQYRHYDQPIEANVTFYTSTITLNAGDKIRVQAGTTTMTFGADGAVMT